MHSCGTERRGRAADTGAMRRALAALIALLLIAPAGAQAGNGGASAGSGGTTSGATTGSTTGSGGTPPSSTGGTIVDPHWVPSAGSGPAPERDPEPTQPSAGSFARSDIP